MMSLITEPYLTQKARWPQTGRQILAQFDDDSIVVYQAYNPSIGQFAAKHGYFGGDFSLTRMSWIKSNFLWMMHRCGWASKPGQEIVLAVRIRRRAFDAILAQAVHSTYVEAIYQNERNWKEALATSAVRLQWDPDHDPRGQKVERRAIQLGMRGEVLRCYAREWIVDITDITPFVHEQYQHVQAGHEDVLLTPRETVYPITDIQTIQRLAINEFKA